MSTPAPVDVVPGMSDAIALVAVVVSVLSIVVAVWAQRIAARSARAADEANRLVGVYKRALWTVDGELGEQDVMSIRLNNEGESPAQNVLLTLDVDPLHTVSSDEPIQLVPQRSSAWVTLTLPPSAMASGPSMAWNSYFNRKDGTRGATIEWDDLEGNRLTARVMIPGSYSSAQ